MESSPVDQYLIREEKEREKTPEVGFQEGVQAVVKGIVELVQSQGRVVQSMAAESASGKGYFYGQVAEQLAKEGIAKEAILTFSTDNYYKGISRMTLERIARTHGLADMDSPEKVQALREVVGNRFFGFKFGNGFKEDGSEIADQSVMADIYNKLESGDELGGDEAARLEWAFRYVLHLNTPEIAGLNFTLPATLNSQRLLEILAENQLDRAAFLAAFSNQGIQNQIQTQLGLEAEDWERVQSEFSTDQLNFDEPEAVDLDQLRLDLEGLKRGDKVEIPEYSMKVGEPIGVSTPTDQPQVVLLEGLYALNEKVVNQADRTAFLQSDRVYQIVRRFSRDLLIEKRSSFSPELLLFIMTHVVYPEANQHVLPDKKKADLLITNNLTDQEDILFRELISEKRQCKNQLNKAQAAALSRKLARRYPQEPTVIKQEDVYVVDSQKGSDRLLRIRIENGALQSLQYQGKPSVSEEEVVSRPFITLCQGPFTFPYADGELPMYPGSRTGYEKLVADLTASGFHISNIISKQRTTYRDGKISINLDEVDGLGSFVEVRSDEGAEQEALQAVVKEFGIRLDTGRTVDSYFDLKSERDLNEGITEEDVAGVYESIEPTEVIKDAFTTLRQGYPGQPYAEQTHGENFREAARQIIAAVAEKSMDLIPPEYKEKVVVVLPWRSALAFTDPYAEKGVDFYHLSSKRNEVTLKTEVDYEEGEIPADAYVVIADPMLATGNTMVDAIERVKAKGVPEEHIILNSVVAAPVGVFKVFEQFPDIQIVVGALDQKLNKFGYIVPGLGDFGDKYFDELEAAQYVKDLVEQGSMSEQAGERLLKRLYAQGGSSPLKLEEQRAEQEATDLTEKGEEAESAELERAKLEERPAYALVARHCARHPEYSLAEVEAIVQDVEQHTGKELERKYRISKPDMAPYLQGAESIQLTQAYVSPSHWEEALRLAGLDLSNWEGAALAEVRIRQQGTSTIVTAKSNKLESGTRRESEQKIDDPTVIEKIFSLADAGTVAKERFTLPVEVDGVALKVEIDQYTRLGKEAGEDVSTYPYLILEIELPGAFLLPLLREQGGEYLPFMKAAEEVTDQSEYDNKNLAVRGFTD